MAEFEFCGVDQCRIIELPRRQDENGDLTEVENTGAYPFPIRRVYYLYDVPADTERGSHAHFRNQTLLVAVSGSFSVTATDGLDTRTFTLNRPFMGLYLPPSIWHTLHDFSSGSVCLALASEPFEEADYIRSYDQFLQLSSEARQKAGRIRFPALHLGAVNAPYISELKAAACRVIDSGYYVGGPEVERLETEVARICATPFAVGASNGLDALRLIFRAYIELGRLHHGDEVLVPADTYVASVLAITDNGLKPVLVDASLMTYNIDPALIEQHITPRTKALMVVHLYGLASWSAELAEVARRHNLIVVEDNAQAIGAVSEYEGLFGTRVTGGLGHAAGLSFYPTKNIGALGDAGAVTTHDPELARVVAALRNYGSDRQYHNVYAGLNCRLDPIQAAMLMVKLPHLDEENAKRREIANIYDSEITNPAVTKPVMPDFADAHVWHQYVVRVADRDAFRRHMLSHGVGTAVHYPAAPHQQPCYAHLAHGPLPVAERIAAEVVSLPISSGLTPSDAHEIASIVNTYRPSSQEL